MAIHLTADICRLRYVRGSLEQLALYCDREIKDDGLDTDKLRWTIAEAIERAEAVIHRLEFEQ